MIAAGSKGRAQGRWRVPSIRNAIASLVVAFFGLVFLGLLGLNARNFAYYAESGWSLAYHFGLPAVLALATFAALRLPAAGRLVLALCFLAGVAGLYGAEFYLTFVAPPCGACRADREGGDFDRRDKIEVIRDLRRAGTQAYPATRAKNLLVADGSGALVPVLGAGEGGLLPLASLPERTVVSCNETGRWMVYRTDEHGFHNPPGLWAGARPLIAMVGDSFTQGNCVPSDGNIAAWLRRRHVRVLNLGIDGSGPLAELAVFREYVEPLAPETVLWFYYEGNDLTKDLSLEMRSPTLMSYALDGEFRQGLAGRRAEVAARLGAYLDRHMPEAIARVDHPQERLVAALKLFRVRGALGLGPVSLGVVDGASEGQFDLFRAILAGAAERTASWGGRLVLVYLPESDRYFGLDRQGRIRERIRARVMATAAALDLPVIDVERAFARQPDPQALFEYPGAHYNVRGYRVAAEAVHAGLEALGR